MFHWVSNGNGNVEHLTDKKRIHNNVPLIDLWSFGCRDLISINKHKYLFLQQTLNFSKHFKFQSMSSNKLFQRIDIGILDFVYAHSILFFRLKKLFENCRISSIELDCLLFLLSQIVKVCCVVSTLMDFFCC